MVVTVVVSARNKAKQWSSSAAGCCATQMAGTGKGLEENARRHRRWHGDVVAAVVSSVRVEWGGS
jgi:hypothetical protein